MLPGCLSCHSLMLYTIVYHQSNIVSSVYVLSISHYDHKVMKTGTMRVPMRNEVLLSFKRNACTFEKTQC